MRRDPGFLSLGACTTLSRPGSNYHHVTDFGGAFASTNSFPGASTTASTLPSRRAALVAQEIQERPLRPATIHAENLTGDPTRLLTGQEDNGSGDILDRPEPPDMDRFDDLTSLGIVIVFPLPTCRRVRQNQPGCHRVARDPERAQLLAQMACETNQSMLGRSVGLDPRETRTQPGTGGDVHDAPPTSSAHDGSHCLCEPKRAINICFENRAPGCGCNLFDGHPTLTSDAAGRIDEDVEPSMGCDQLRYELVAKVPIADIERDADQTMPFGKLRDALDVDIRNDDARARCHKGKRDGLPNPLGSPGDENYATVEAEEHSATKG